MRYVTKIGDREYRFDLREEGGSIVVTHDGKSFDVDLERITAEHLFSLLLESRSYEVEVHKNQDSYKVCLEGETYSVVVEDERLSQLNGLLKHTGAVIGARELKAPMPGLVSEVEVQPGDHVKKGQGILIVEAMKMENELRANFDGVVKDVRVKKGQAVEQGQVLIVFE